MTAIPAVAAGVPAPVILTPPGEDGNIDPATLVSARLAGETAAKAGARRPLPPHLVRNPFRNVRR